MIESQAVKQAVSGMGSTAAVHRAIAAVMAESFSIISIKRRSGGMTGENSAKEDSYLPGSTAPAVAELFR